MPPPALTGRQRRTFAILTILFAFAAAAAATLLLDIYVHHRQQAFGAINVWGYRGPIAGRKQRGERRIIIIGGSTVFGWKYSWQQAFPAMLERDLRERVPTPVSVVNLGFPRENAYAYRAVFEDYRYLDPDLVVFYGDRNARSTPVEILRHESLIFRLTGYYPMLPTAMREKAMVLRYGDLDTARMSQQAPAPDAPIVKKAAAWLLGAAGTAADSLARPLNSLGRRAPESPVATPTCAEPWRAFCDAMFRAIVAVREQHKPVLVVTEPLKFDLQRQEQRVLRAMLAARFEGDREVHYLDLADAVDLNEPGMAIDEFHLSDIGNRRIADRLRDYIQPLMWSGLPQAASSP